MSLRDLIFSQSSADEEDSTKPISNANGMREEQNEEDSDDSDAVEDAIISKHKRRM